MTDQDLEGVSWARPLTRRRLLRQGVGGALALSVGGAALGGRGAAWASGFGGGPLQPGKNLVLQTFGSSYPDDNQLIKIFNSQYGVNASVIDIPANYYATTETRLLGGAPPMDTFQEDPGFLTKFYTNKWIVPLDGLPGVDQLTADMYPSVRAACTAPDGKLVALPYYTASYVLFYNAAILKKYGMKPATSWDEMYAQGLTLKKKGVPSPIVPLWSTAFDLTNYSFINECVSRGLHNQFDAKFNPLWDKHPAGRAVLNYWKQLQKAKIIPPDAVTQTYHQAEAVIQGGQGVYFMMDNGQLKALNSKATSKVAGQIKVAQIPGKTHAGTGFTSVYYQTTRSDPEAAWPLTRFYGGTDKNGKFTGPIQGAAITEGLRTGYKSTDTDPAVIKASRGWATPDDLEMFVKQAGVTYGQGPVVNEKWYSDYNDLMAQTLSKFLAGQISVDEALSSSAQQVRKLKA